MIDEKILQRTMQLTEEFFDTRNDTTQIPISFDSYHKLIKLWPEAFNYELDNKGEPISWAVVVPTSRDLMNKFLTKEITECQLLEQTVPAESYESLYLCSAFTIPAVRRHGLALKLLLKIIKTAPLTPGAALFTWPTMLAGYELVGKLEVLLGKKILLRSTG